MWRWKGGKVYAVVLIRLLKICINSKKKKKKLQWGSTCSNLCRFKISNLQTGSTRMKVNEVSRQQRLKSCGQTSGHSESLRCSQCGDFFFFFSKGLGHQPGRIYQKPSNWPTHGPDANKFGLNEVHLMLLYSSFEMQHKTFTLISDEGTNKRNFLAFFWVMDCTKSNETNYVNTGILPPNKNKHKGQNRE